MNDLDSKSLLGFFQTGGLDQLYLGQTLDEVRRLLDEPISRKIPARSDSIFTYDYGALELTFQNRFLYIISLDFASSLSMPSLLSIGWFGIIRSWTLNEFVNFMQENELVCHEVVTSELNDVEWTFKELGKLLLVGKANVEVSFYTGNYNLGQMLSCSEPNLHYRLVDCDEMNY